ncbi:MAG: SdiA-regulated domain-containing protein [Deltaproteobacteria bacterium]|nr:SdiA-regulated domain-containing protein [Deltaproteobacteria bacterium]
MDSKKKPNEKADEGKKTKDGKKGKDGKKDEKAKKKDEKAKKKDAKAKKKDEKDEKAKKKDAKAKKKDEKAKKKGKKAKDNEKAKKDEKTNKVRDGEKAKKKGKKGKKAKDDEKAEKVKSDLPAIPLTLLDQTPLGLRSASAIAHVGGGHALVVDDDEGIYVASADGQARLVLGRDEFEALGDLESICTSDDGKTAYVVTEESGEVLAMKVARRGASVTLSDLRSLGTLERPGNTENKGWEGASHLVTPSGPCLVVAHEREPKVIAVHSLPSLALLSSIDLDDGPLGALVDDVSDIAVCPTTDHLFVLSDESHCIVETRLDVEASRLEILGVFRLDLDAKDKPEGIAFESPTTLVIVTDNPSRRLRFRLARGSIS